ncbi:hypothetical protein Tco_0448535, partial [Tanacetum coccineum]
KRGLTAYIHERTNNDKKTLKGRTTLKNLRMGERSRWVIFQQLIVGYDAKRTEVKEFTDWILDIGDGKVGGKNVGNAVVEFLEEWLIPDSTDHVGAVIQEIYLDLFLIL